MTTVLQNIISCSAHIISYNPVTMDSGEEVLQMIFLCFLQVLVGSPQIAAIPCTVYIVNH